MLRAIINVDRFCAGHASGHQRHTLGVRAQPLVGQKRTGHHDPVAGQERAVRHRAVRHTAPVFDDAAGHDLCTRAAAARQQ